MTNLASVKPQILSGRCVVKCMMSWTTLLLSSDLCMRRPCRKSREAHYLGFSILVGRKRLSGNTKYTARGDEVTGGRPSGVRCTGYLLPLV